MQELSRVRAKFSFIIYVIIVFKTNFKGTQKKNTLNCEFILSFFLLVLFFLCFPFGSLDFFKQIKNVFFFFFLFCNFTSSNVDGTNTAEGKENCWSKIEKEK